MIKFKNIDDLNRDNKQAGLYDLYVTTFINNKKLTVYGYRVQRGEGMRIDKICRNIYGNENHLSFLLDLNDIINPLTIKEGNLLIYVNENDITSFIINKNQKGSIREEILSKAISDKKQQVDKARKDYVNTRQSVTPLPPNVKETSDSPIIIGESEVKVILDKDQSLKAKNTR